MGKQVNFWMLPEDESIFMEYLRERKNTALIKPKSSELEVEIVDFDLVLSNTEPMLLIWDKTNPIEDRHFIDKHHYFIIDRFNAAPVIEYSRSTLTSGIGLSRGRIWAEMYLLQGQEFFHKGSEFEDFYDSIARWLRRNLMRIKELSAYLGPAAVKWYQKGGNLIG